MKFAMFILNKGELEEMNTYLCSQCQIIVGLRQTEKECESLCSVCGESTTHFKVFPKCIN